MKLHTRRRSAFCYRRSDIPKHQERTQGALSAGGLPYIPERKYYCVDVDFQEQYHVERATSFKLGSITQHKFFGEEG